MKARMTNIFNFIVPETAKGQRLDIFLVEFSQQENDMPALSRARIKDLISQGCFRMKGKDKVYTSQILKGGESFAFRQPELGQSDYKPENIPLDIVYDDPDFVVINKKAGMVVHPALGHPKGTLFNAVLHQFYDELAGIGGVRQPGIIHRLDRYTSGLIMVAKTERAHQTLSKMMEERQVQKTYQAIIWGALDGDGVVDAPIGRDSHDQKRMIIRKRGGRNAITHYKTVKTSKEASLIECEIDTGRTHQIRVHLSARARLLGNKEYYGVVGDPLYSKMPKDIAPKIKEFLKSAAWGEGRYALHAAQLKFVHPFTDKEVVLSLKAPESFELLMDYLDL